jgi:lipid-binding SYLF domain-containing protein
MKSLNLPLLAAAVAMFVAPHSNAETARTLRVRSERALNHLYANNHKAREIGEKAIAVLVFPDVYKAGFMVGAQTGNGVLFRNGSVNGYYNSTAASYGFQAGIQKFSYVLFFMDQKSLHYLNKSGGFEVGGAPSLVVADEGFSSSLSTTTLQKGIYAFFFGQKGLMAGIGLQGTKISQYTPSE